MIKSRWRKPPALVVSLWTDQNDLRSGVDPHRGADGDRWGADIGADVHL